MSNLLSPAFWFFSLIILLASVVAKADTDVGVEWINDFPVCGFDALGGRDDTAVGFYDVLTANGYTGRFNWGNGAAWATDFMDNNAVASMVYLAKSYFSPKHRD